MELIKKAKGKFQSLKDRVSRTRPGQAAGGLIEALIGIVVGLSLYPVVTDVVAGVNASGVEATLIELVPTLYVISVIVGAIAWTGLTTRLD